MLIKYINKNYDNEIYNMPKYKLIYDLNNQIQESDNPNEKPKSKCNS